MRIRPTPGGCGNRGRLLPPSTLPLRALLSAKSRPRRLVRLSDSSQLQVTTPSAPPIHDPLTPPSIGRAAMHLSPRCRRGSGWWSAPHHTPLPPSRLLGRGEGGGGACAKITLSRAWRDRSRSAALHGGRGSPPPAPRQKKGPQGNLYWYMYLPRPMPDLRVSACWLVPAYMAWAHFQRPVLLSHTPHARHRPRSVPPIGRERFPRDETEIFLYLPCLPFLNENPRPACSVSQDSISHIANRHRSREQVSLPSTHHQPSPLAWQNHPPFTHRSTFPHAETDASTSSLLTAHPHPSLHTDHRIQRAAHPRSITTHQLTNQRHQTPTADTLAVSS